MKRSKRIYLLLGILAVACIATIVVKGLEEHKEKIKNSDEIILQVPTNSVKTLSWKNESADLAFHWDEKWLYDEDEAFPVDEEEIEKLLEQFESFGVAFIIEDVEDYGQYGLDEPICTINFSTEEKSYELKLGDFSTMDKQRYVSIGDENVYLVRNDPLDHFNAVLSDMIDHDNTPTFSKVSEIQFAGNETYGIIYEEDSPNTYNAADIYFAELEGKKLALDTSKVRSYLNNISYLTLKDYVTYKVSDDELKTYGLDAPELTVTVKYITENETGEEITDSLVLNVSRDPEEKKAAEEAKKEADDEAVDEESGSPEEEEITAYARVGASQIVYKISSDDYKELMAASYDSLRHAEVLSADFNDITQLDITLDGMDYTFRSEEKDDRRIFYYQDKELDMTNIQSALKFLKADSFTDEEPTKKEEISLTVHLDNENFPEVKINLYRYDGSHCLAVIDGKPVSLVTRSYTVDLIEAIYAIVLN